MRRVLTHPPLNLPFEGGEVDIPFLSLSLFFALVLLLCTPASALAASLSREAPVQQIAAAGDPLTELAANFPSYDKATVQIVVSVSINREAKGDFFAELDEAGALFLKVEDLVALQLNFARDQTVLIREERLVPLSGIQDVVCTFDEKSLTVGILGKTTQSENTTIELYSLQSRPQNVYYPRENSAFVNYGLTYSHAYPLGFQSLSVSNKIGARSGDISLVSDSLYRKTETTDQFVRLATSATYERRADLLWLVMGDQFVNSGDLGGSVNIGGIGFSKVYRLDPYLITQPLFTLNGVTQFPSEAEIYMDGMLVRRHAIAPGSFELKNIYSYAGSHLVDVVLKDPFGNEQRISYPLYFNTQLLRQGLHEYSYNAGFLREHYGVESNDYGKPVFSAYHRYGVTSALNVGARAEASDTIRNAGVSFSFLLPRMGAFTVSLAGSDTNGGKGSAGSFQHSYQHKSFSMNLLGRAFSRDYSTVATPVAENMIKYAVSAYAGFQIPPLGSFSLGYTSTTNFGRTNMRVTSINFSRALSRITSMFASASATGEFGDMTHAVFAGLTFTPGGKVRGSAQVSKSGNTNTETVQLQRDTPLGEGFGYRASLNRTGAGPLTTSAFNPSLQYNARYGIYTVDSSLQNTGSDNFASYAFSAAGSIAYAGGFFGFSRPVNDSFSIVMIDGLPNAAVLNNGQEIGKTNSLGRIVVPTLSSYNQNQITLDVKNMPLDYSISGVNRKISPSQWSGSCVSFETTKVRALAGALFFPQGDKKIPMEYVDVILQVNEQQVLFPTGRGGELYLENSSLKSAMGDSKDNQTCGAIAERRKFGGKGIPPGVYSARVKYSGGVCEFPITFPETDDPITDIGEVVCIPR